MTDADEALQRVWPLSQPERLDELENAIEPVLDLLVDAGYAEVDGRRWRFTRAGVERAKALAAKQTDKTPWPYEDDRFPRRLGVLVMKTILDGNMPVLQVVHAPEDWWGFADGVSSPNGDASITVHVHHVLDIDSSLQELATLPPGFKADRDEPDSPWVVTEFEYGEDD
jgi:hypothetical protein